MLTWIKGGGLRVRVMEREEDTVHRRVVNCK